MSQSTAGFETNQRVLAAATEVFVEVGYRGATLREICRRGRANIAAVNYYFRDKEQLYAAVLEQAVVAAGEGIAQLAPDPAQAPEEKLRHFVREFLDNLLGGDRPVQLLRLMAHELVEPTPALDLVVEMALRPVIEILRAIVAELLGHTADAMQIRDCVSSILAQCSAYHHSKAVIQRVDHLDVHDPQTIEHLADHIVRFSLGGIRAVSRHGQAAGSNPPASQQDFIAKG
jgi:TetR/AcrR family transcriptional regulator, regulator of cefoperazone and chloramphenicol sensitivity